MGLRLYPLRRASGYVVRHGQNDFHGSWRHCRTGRNLIRERVVMGLDRVSKQRERLGRPRTLFDRGKAETLLQRHSQRETARTPRRGASILEKAIQEDHL